MKRILTVAALIGSAAFVMAQGTINFTTFNFAPVTNSITGQRVSGAAYLGQLYYGPAGIASGDIDNPGLVSVADAPKAFGTGATAGFILSAVGTVTGIPGGAAGSFQLRAWEAVLGATWEAALAAAPGNTAAVLGKSRVIQVTTGNPTGTPPTTPASLGGATGLTGFAISPIPEPSVIALGLIGLGVLAWRRRK